MKVYGVKWGCMYEGCSFSENLFLNKDRARMEALIKVNQENKIIEKMNNQSDLLFEKYKEHGENVWKTDTDIIAVVEFNVI